MSELEPSRDAEQTIMPMTALCIVSDKNKAPHGFQTVTKCQDDQSDADLWRDGMWTFSRSVRYLCYTKTIPEGAPTSSVPVVTNIIVVKETDPIPHGFVAIDYTVDSREKSLRKKYICVRTEPRDRVVDAVGEIVILAKSKKTPRDYTLAGEVDSLSICFKVVAIPQTYGMRTSSSTSQIQSEPTGLYPALGPNVNHSASSPAMEETSKIDNYTIKSSLFPKVKGIDGVPFKLNPKMVRENINLDDLPNLSDIVDIEKLRGDIGYSFALEKAVLSMD